MYNWNLTYQSIFWDNKARAGELELQIMTKDREMEQLEENHRVEVRVYVQKVKHWNTNIKIVVKKLNGWSRR